MRCRQLVIGSIVTVAFFVLTPPAYAQDELPESCRAGVSSEGILRLARERARLSDLMPAVGESEIRVTKLEALTAEEHYDRYEEVLLMEQVPVVEKLECVWRVEAAGTGELCGGSSSARCSPINRLDLGFFGDSGAVWYEAIHFQDEHDELPGACREGMSGDEAAHAARVNAYGNGLRPASGLGKTSVLKLEALTVEQHDDRYPAQRQRGPGIFPQPPASRCIWRVEVEGVGWFFGGRAGFYGFTRRMDFGFDGPTGDLRYDVIRFANDPWRIWLPISVSRR